MDADRKTTLQENRSASKMNRAPQRPILTDAEQLAASYWRLGNYIRHFQLFDAMQYLSDILSGQMPIPFAPGCLCFQHLDRHIGHPARCFLLMCDTMKNIAISRGINPAHVYVGHIMVTTRVPFDLTPIRMELRCIVDPREWSPGRRTYRRG